MNASDPLLNEVTRVLACYSKQDESLVAEHPLRAIDLVQLQSLFHPPPDDPLMYDCYPVGQREAVDLSRALGVPIDQDRFDYFIECHTANDLGQENVRVTSQAEPRLPGKEPGQGGKTPGTDSGE